MRTTAEQLKACDKSIRWHLSRLRHEWRVRDWILEDRRKERVAERAKKHNSVKRKPL